MARLTPLHLVPALLAAATHAGEITIEAQPFFVSHRFNATVVPLEPVLIAPVGKIWRDFTLAEIVPHGTRVNAGDLLVKFDAIAIDREIERTRLARDAGAQTVAQADLALKQLNETAPLRHAALRLAARQAKEDLDHFNTTGRKAAEDRANQSLNIARHLLAQQREELNRLAKVHESEKLADQPEPLPVIRQRDAVATSEFTYRMETLDQERTLKVLIPREAETLAAREREAAAALKQAEAELPQQLGFKKFELDSAKAAAARLAADLAALEADRALFEVRAPAAGWLFHGAIDERFPSGLPPVATFVPAGSKTGLVAHLSEATARVLAKHLEGSATIPGLVDSNLPLRILSIAEAPEPDALYRTEISTVWPQGVQPVPGSTVEARFISHQKPAAIAVPHHALAFGPAGWTVDVKLADGKTEPRPVKPGLVAEHLTEILSGLEPGQVILVPVQPR